MPGIGSNCFVYSSTMIFLEFVFFNHLLEHLEQPSEANQRWMFWTSFNDIRIRFGKLKTLRLSDDEPEYVLRLSLPPVPDFPYYRHQVSNEKSLMFRIHRG